MSAAWGSEGFKTPREEEARAKRFVRLWGYLSIAGLFLMYVAQSLGINLF